ncbi:MAG: amidohydrolase [Actinomycetota bacterium]
MRCDLVLDNANVITVDPAMPRANSVGIVGDRIVAVSVAERIDGARRIDLGGRTVVPGFNDAHNHMQAFGAALNEVPLQPDRVRSVEEIVAAIADRAADTPDGVWVIGTGYDNNKLAERRHPTRYELDAVSPDNPVLLNHTSGHFCVVNTAAMRLARIGEVAVPEGGVVAVGDDGQPNGLLEEQAQTLARALLHPRAISDMVQNLGAASDVYLSEGITSCQEAGVGGILGTKEPLELAAYQQARRTGRLRVRVTLMPAVETLHTTDHHPDDDEPFVLDLGLHSGFGDDWLKFGPVKIFADGSLIGRTAAMSEDFDGEPGNNGYFQMDEQKLHTLIGNAHRSGWQVATHAIGDRAVASVLDAYQEAQARHPRADTRHRIEHCGMCRAEDVARIAALGVIPVPQGRFINEIGDGMLRAIGDRRPDCYRQRSFLDAGVPLPGSSDRPVVNGAPLLGIHDMVNQRTDSGQPFNPHEAVTAEEAVRSFTLHSAVAAFDEGRKGSIEVGKLADLTVLDRDLTTIDPADIATTTVEATMVGGRFEYDPAGLDG